MVTSSRTPAVVAPAQRGLIWLWLLRVVGAGLLAAMGYIHWYVWYNFYSGIHIIGPLFLANMAGGAVLALGVLATPRRFLPIVSALGWLFMVGTLLALVLSMTLPGGLFGFPETIDGPQVTTTIGVESAGIVELALLAVAALMLNRKHSIVMFNRKRSIVTDVPTR